jgi:hypothetical protein
MAQTFYRVFWSGVSKIVTDSFIRCDGCWCFKQFSKENSASRRVTGTAWSVSLKLNIQAYRTKPVLTD